MRPGQKNRMRGGRGNNGNSRRGPNPLTRSYESNGPDVKVRGTPQHIAEKYVQLARDAHSASDTVMAESYLQHAEHYYRIIAAAQNAQQQAYNQANGITGPELELEDEDEFEVAGADRFTFRAPQNFQQTGGFSNQQPYQQGQSFNNDLAGADQPSTGDAQPAMGEAQPPFNPGQQPRGERQPYNNRRFDERGDRQDGRGDGRQDGRQEGRQDRRFGRDRGNRSFGDRNAFDGRPQGDRQPGDRQFGDRQFGDRQSNDRSGNDRQADDRPQGDRPSGDRSYNDRPPRDRGDRMQSERSFGDRGGERAAPQPRAEMASPVTDEPAILPSFITAPVRAIPIAEAPAVSEPSGEAETGIRPRRRRRKADDVAAPAEAGDE